MTPEELKLVDWLRRRVGFRGVVKLIERLQRGTDPCGWERDMTPDGDDVWNTGCDHIHQFSVGNWRDNSYHFCPYCGGKIIEVGEESAHE